MYGGVQPVQIEQFPVGAHIKSGLCNMNHKQGECRKTLLQDMDYVLCLMPHLTNTLSKPLGRKYRVGSSIKF